MDVVKELSKWNIKTYSENADSVKIRCPNPSHEDKNPSCVVKLEEGNFYCPVCQKGGDFFNLLSKATGVPASIHKKQIEGGGRKVSPKKVEAWYAALLVAGHLTSGSKKALRELNARGVSDDTLKRYMIGFDADKHRITIPIMWGDNFCNTLFYSPGAAENKFFNYAKGFGSIPILYPQDQLTYSKLVLCGGPIKALSVLERLNTHGIGAVCSTFGESTIKPELVPWFVGKTVWVCFDIDKHGQHNSDLTCGMLKHSTKWVGNVKLPLNVDLYPKGDINDYFGTENSSTEAFLELLNTCPEWRDQSFSPEFTEEHKDVSISELCGFKRAFNFSTTAFLSGVDDSNAHKVPKEIKVTCTADSDVCSLCKLQRSATYDPFVGMSIPVEVKNPLCLSFVNISHKQRTTVFKEYLSIPEQCYKCSFEPSEDMYTVRYVLLSDIETDSEIPVSAAVYTDGGELYSGEVCYLKGRADQSPLTSEEVRIITEHEPKDILSQYSVRNSSLLSQFRTKDDSLQSLQDKIDDINIDLETNVTYIYDRPQVHTLFDLTFHSPLWIPFENAIEPGWISVLLVSETAQGKSTIMRRLINHYGHGSYIDAANTSIAGLVGGIKSIGKRQFVKWGILPQMDKRLVCIEEYANAPVELLRSMRAARDSGVVSLNKIDKGRANARTRTIVLSNPKRLIKPGVVIDGISLLEDLVERPEDLRRFDVGMWIPKLEVEKRLTSSTPKYSAEACHELITWAWTLPKGNIRFTPEALEAIRTNRMKEKYPFLYLVGMREFDAKLARLSAAIACRTYNVHNDVLQIEERHVEWVCNFLSSLYDDPEFGYGYRVRREADMDASCTIDQIVTTLKISPNPVLLCEFLISYNRYVIDDLKAAVGDSFTWDQVKNRLIILGCMVGEDDAKWNNAYLPTKRLKKLLPEILTYIKKQYRVPGHLKQAQPSEFF